MQVPERNTVRHCPHDGGTSNYIIRLQRPEYRALGLGARPTPKKRQWQFVASVVLFFFAYFFYGAREDVEKVGAG